MYVHLWNRSPLARPSALVQERPPGSTALRTKAATPATPGRRRKSAAQQLLHPPSSLAKHGGNNLPQTRCRCPGRTRLSSPGTGCSRGPSRGRSACQTTRAAVAKAASCRSRATWCSVPDPSPGKAPCTQPKPAMLASPSAGTSWGPGRCWAQFVRLGWVPRGGLCPVGKATAVVTAAVPSRWGCWPAAPEGSGPGGTAQWHRLWWTKLRPTPGGGSGSRRPQERTQGVCNTRAASVPWSPPPWIGGGLPWCDHRNNCRDVPLSWQKCREVTVELPPTTNQFSHPIHSQVEQRIWKSMAIYSQPTFEPRSLDVALVPGDQHGALVILARYSGARCCLRWV